MEILNLSLFLIVIGVPARDISILDAMSAPACVLKNPCDLVKECDWPWLFPTRYNSCRFYKLSTGQPSHLTGATPPIVSGKT